MDHDPQVLLPAADQEAEQEKIGRIAHHVRGILANLGLGREAEAEPKVTT